MGNWNQFSIPSNASGYPPNGSGYTLNGPGYSVQMPPGFSASPPDPMTGGSFAWPPDSWGPPNSPALIWLLPVMPYQFQALLQHYYSLDNPMVAAMDAQSLGLMNVTGMEPLRQTVLNGATGYVREFNAFSMKWDPLRVSAMLLQGPSSALQCIVGINLYRWAEFTGQALQFVGRIQLSGTSAASGEVRSVIDRQNPGRVEMQVVNADKSVAPVMTMPTTVQGQQVVQIIMQKGSEIKFANLEATEVQIGPRMTGDSLAGDEAPAASGSTNKIANSPNNVENERKPSERGATTMAQFTFEHITANVVNNADSIVQNNTTNNMNQADRDEVVALLGLLKQQVQQAPIPEEAKKEITDQVLPDMHQAASQPDPNPGLRDGLGHVNAVLQKVDVAGGSLAGIVGTVAKIAAVVGPGIKLIAPFLGTLL